MPPPSPTWFLEPSPLLWLASSPPSSHARHRPRVVTQGADQNAQAVYQSAVAVAEKRDPFWLIIAANDVKGETIRLPGADVSPIDAQWDESQPIYRQLRDRVVAMMLEGALKEGEALPSVRQVATEYRLNPLTVLKAYQQLVDEGLVEKRRGLGMFVAPGREQGPDEGRARAGSWTPNGRKIQATIQRLGPLRRRPAEQAAADHAAAAERTESK